jgi:hypothetical protein
MTATSLSRRWLALFGMSLIVTAIAFICLKDAPRAHAAAADAAKQGRAAQLLSLNLKFSGVQSCAGNGCHNSPQPKPTGMLMNEMSTWTENDAHAQAYKVLESVPKRLARKHPELTDIAKKLGIDNATTSDRCLSCHALNAPANLRGAQFDVTEGATCSSCHGPSDKWLADHKNEKWTQKQRDARAGAGGAGDEWAGQGAHAKLLADLGLYDTKPLVARAEICVACHLAIDPALVEAGHPQPYFELNYFQETQPKHWREMPRDAGVNHVRIWAVGQVVSLREAANQLAMRCADSGAKPEALKEALAQVLAHGAMVEQMIKAGAIKAPNAKLDELAKLKAGLGAPSAALGGSAKAVADQFKNLANPAMEMQPTKEMATALAKAIAADGSLAKDLGRAGAQQQALAVWSLVTAVNPAAADGDELKVLVEFRSPYRSDKDKFDADAYGGALKAAGPK